MSPDLPFVAVLASEATELESPYFPPGGIHHTQAALYAGLYDRGEPPLFLGILRCPSCRAALALAPLSGWVEATCERCGARLYVGRDQGWSWAIEARLGRFLRSDGAEGVVQAFVPRSGRVERYLVCIGPAPRPPPSSVRLLNPGLVEEDPIARRFSLLEVD